MAQISVTVVSLHCKHVRHGCFEGPTCQKGHQPTTECAYSLRAASDACSKIHPSGGREPRDANKDPLPHEIEHINHVNNNTHFYWYLFTRDHCIVYFSVNDNIHETHLPTSKTETTTKLKQQRKNSTAKQQSHANQKAIKDQQNLAHKRATAWYIEERRNLCRIFVKDIEKKVK